MTYCEADKERDYWACPRQHDPRGVVLRGDYIDHAFDLSRVGVYDKFDRGVEEPVSWADEPGDVSGLVVTYVLQKLARETEFKRMRQRKGHDSLDGLEDRSVEADQSDLGAWST